MRISMLVLLVNIVWIGLASTANAKTCSEAAQNLNVLYFTPGDLTDPFWSMQVRYMQRVAASLNIDLDILQIDDQYDSRFRFIDAIAEQISATKKPDIILGIFYLNGEQAFLEYIENNDLLFFSVNSSLNKSVLDKIGYPREKFNNWIGHMSPDDELGGYMLARELTINGKQNPLVLAVAGEHRSLVSLNRTNGLQRAHDDFEFELLPPIHTDWSRSNATSATERAFNLFDNIDVIWTVGSHSALGVLDYMEQRNIPPAELRIGTFDWATEVLFEIEKGNIDYVFGGHFKEAGWTLMLAYDYFSGIDFKESIGTYIQTPLQKVSQQNVSEVLASIDENWHSVDFKKYLKCFDESSQTYPFINLSK